MATSLTCVAALGLALFVTGCGGGGEEVAPPTTDPSSSQPISDATTPPATGATTPTTGATGVATSTGTGALPLTTPSAGDVGDLAKIGAGSLFDVQYDLNPASTTDETFMGDDVIVDPVPDDTDAVDPEEKCVTETTYDSAKITLNDSTYSVEVGTAFPDDTQQFTVSSISGSTVVLSLTAGEFSDGSDGITLEKGEATTLVNQSEGITYTLELTKTSASEDATTVCE